MLLYSFLYLFEQAFSNGHIPLQTCLVLLVVKKNKWEEKLKIFTTIHDRKHKIKTSF